MKIQEKTLKLSDLEPNKGQLEGLPKNPRIIKDNRFKALKKSIEDSPEFLKLRELIVYPTEGEKFIVIAGNQRLAACKDLKISEVPCKILPASTSIEKLKEYTIKDNVSFGEMDWEVIKDDWDLETVSNWGEVVEWDPKERDQKQEDVYSKKISIPNYEPKGEKYKTTELTDNTRYKDLIRSIEKSKVSEEEKEFLKIAATRHYEISFNKVAEYYATASKEMQNLMEAQALVIIDFNEAIENGYVRLSEDILDQYKDEYDE